LFLSSTSRLGECTKGIADGSASHLPALRADVIPLFGQLLVDRSIPSEVIVKVTAVVIGLHWHARMGASTVSSVLPGDEEGQAKATRRKYEAEEHSLDLLFAIFSLLLRVSFNEVEEASQSLSNRGLADRLNESALVVDDGEEAELHQYISAVLRRILPSLRIISKWIKSHTDYVSRTALTPNEQLRQAIEEFWQRYYQLMAALDKLFPIAQLPSLHEALEEDVDMRGFLPLKRGLTEKSSNGQEFRHDVHPNEEQLMRISDLLVDAKLLMQNVGYHLIALMPRLAMPHCADSPC
jgi:hypothetical protein